MRFALTKLCLRWGPLWRVVCGGRMFVPSPEGGRHSFPRHRGGADLGPQPVLTEARVRKGACGKLRLWDSSSQNCPCPGALLKGALPPFEDGCTLGCLPSSVTMSVCSDGVPGGLESRGPCEKVVRVFGSYGLHVFPPPSPPSLPFCCPALSQK